MYNIKSLHDSCGRVSGSWVHSDSSMRYGSTSSPALAALLSYLFWEEADKVLKYSDFLLRLITPQQLANAIHFVLARDLPALQGNGC